MVSETIIAIVSHIIVYFVYNGGEVIAMFAAASPNPLIPSEDDVKLAKETRKILTELVAYCQNWESDDAGARCLPGCECYLSLRAAELFDALALAVLFRAKRSNPVHEEWITCLEPIFQDRSTSTGETTIPRKPIRHAVCRCGSTAGGDIIFPEASNSIENDRGPDSGLV